jgi:hypothetical protein
MALALGIGWIKGDSVTCLVLEFLEEETDF